MHKAKRGSNYLNPWLTCPSFFQAAAKLVEMEKLLEENKILHRRNVVVSSQWAAYNVMHKLQQAGLPGESRGKV